MNVPFVDLKNQYLSIKEEIDHAIFSTISETSFIGGKIVKEFEESFSNLYGVKNCVSVANGTDAIYIVLKMLGIGTGDEVITVANSWISTSETISQTGATPVFVDIDEFFTINTNKIEKLVNKNTKAIIPVHLYGQMADITKIKKICDLHNLFLIEDCAQSHFSELNGQRAGTFGDAATFSFYPGKNLGAYGDAGAIITNNESLAQKCRMFSNHGALIKHQHKIEGINSRLDGIQAAILTVKLNHILKWTEMRIQNAIYYNKLLTKINQIEIPKIRKNSKHTFHLYVIKTDYRDELADYLKDKGISTAIHYPVPLPFMDAYDYLKINKNDFKVVKENSDKILSLPMYPELNKSQIEYTVANIKKFFDNVKK